MSFLWETDFEKIGFENAFGNLYEESDEESESGDQLGVGLKRGRLAVSKDRCVEGLI